jgi:hypothetical protein
VRHELSRKDHEAGGAVHDQMAKLHRMDHEAGGAIHDEWVKLKYGDRRSCAGRGARDERCSR